MPQTSPGDIGHWGEDLAACALGAQGYHIIEQNWRCAAGEIDLIAHKDEAVIFVEVKLRHSNSLGKPEEAVTPGKQARLLSACQAYLMEHDLADVAWRIDVVAITVAVSGRVLRIDHYEDAVRADG
jgi:putative endonuclease